MVKVWQNSDIEALPYGPWDIFYNPDTLVPHEPF